MLTSRRFRFPLAVFAALFLALGLAACDDESAGPEEDATVEDVAEGDDDGIADEGVDDEEFDVESFVGEEVTVSGDVSEIISDNAFRIAGGDVGGEALLVFNAQTMPDLDTDSVVRVTGTVREVVIDTFEDDFGFDPEFDIGAFEGEHAISATNVRVIEETSGENG